MLFDGGKKTHDTYHNQYASGMAEATRAGLAAAFPGERPFLISRSGYTGIGKYSALWTGDNMSNYHYLRNCIAVSLNLALSGVPFNGPDIGGFAGDSHPQLIQDWVKTCFLFPFCRNHSMIGSHYQEPWAFDDQTLRIMKHYIQLRYALRPYLYNLFIQQAAEGDAILRPLFHDFEDTAELPLGRLDDEFLVGPAILQAPILSEQERTREVLLPGPSSWFSVMDNRWQAGGQKIAVTPNAMQTPLYLREGSVIPMTPALPEENTFDGRDIVFHVLLHRDSASPADYAYRFDDGISHDYLKGKRSTLKVTAAVCGRSLDIQAEYLAKGYGACRLSFLVYDHFESVRIDGKPATATKTSITLGGSDITAWQVDAGPR
jgi:alpha-glucosidase